MINIKYTKSTNSTIEFSIIDNTTNDIGAMLISSEILNGKHYFVFSAIFKNKSYTEKYKYHKCDNALSNAVSRREIYYHILNFEKFIDTFIIDILKDDSEVIRDLASTPEHHIEFNLKEYFIDQIYGND